MARVWYIIDADKKAPQEKTFKRKNLKVPFEKTLGEMVPAGAEECEVIPMDEQFSIRVSEESAV